MNHWETVFENFKERALDCLRDSVQHGNVFSVSDTRKAYNQAHPDEPAFIVYEYPETPVRFLTICETNPAEKRIEVVSGYPFLKEGEPTVFEVLDIVPGGDGSDGTIECVSRSGDILSFFDPFLCYDKDELRIGSRYEFSVAGIAYQLDHVPNPEFEIDSGPALEAERQRALKVDPDADISAITSVRFSTAELRCLMPRDEPGDAEFQTVVEKVEWFDLAGTKLCKMRCSFRGSDENEWPFALYASQWILKGYQPKEGDVVQGVMWMQAFPLKEIESPAAEKWIDRASEHDARMEGWLRAFEAKEYLSDLHPGVGAMGSALIGGGWDVTKYEKENSEIDVPDFCAERGDRKVDLWVTAYFPEKEERKELPESAKCTLSEISQARGKEAAFVTVKCREVENYYHFDFEETDRIRNLFGDLSFLEASRIPGTEDCEAQTQT